MYGVNVINIYKGKAADVCRVLLVRYPEGFTLRNLARESHVSLGQVSKVSKALINERIAIRDSSRSELKLMAPFELLKRWATVSNFQANTKFIEYYTQEEDISKFLEKFKKLNYPRYAVTGLTGAMYIAPFVRPTNVHIYVESANDAIKLANSLNLMQVEENGNVKFAIAECKGVFYGAREINEIVIASDIQLYVDLLNFPARGEEAAGEIYKEIKNNWKFAEMG
jgi:hypothetical protein